MLGDQPAYRVGYRQGWGWGVVCGLVAGTCTTGLAVLLVRTVLAELARAQ